MKTLFCIFVSFFAISAFAAKPAFLFDMEVSMGGDEPKILKLSLEEGALGAISAKSKTTGQYIELVASEESVNNDTASIRMQFKLYKVNEGGEKILISSPSIIALEGKEAELKRSGEDKSNAYSLKVVAKRLVL